MNEDDPKLPSWRLRRRLAFGTVAFSAGLIILVVFRWEDLMIASELLRIAQSLWLAVTSFYFGSAVVEDIKYRDHYR